MIRKFFTALIIVLAACSAPKAHAQSPVLGFTLDTTTGADKRSVIPKLTWNTTPAATSCTASGSSSWTGAKTPAGTVSLPAVSATVTYTLVCNWPGITKMVVAWTAPTKNIDGSPLTNLQGYRVQYGTTNSEAGLSQSVYTENLLTTWTSPDLAPGQWFAAVRAYNSLGIESDLSSPIVSKTTAAGASDTRALELAIKIPNAPTGVQ